jgi:guanine deaminase
MDTSQLNNYYLEAQEEARAGVSAGHGGPFGAVVVKDGAIVGRGHNTVLRDTDPTCHAEVNAIRDACRALGSPHLAGCVLIASSEPCPMCLTASYWANLDEVRYCVPVEKAAEVGFDDSFIYDELAKSRSERRMLLVHDSEMQAQGEKIFQEWQESGGELY